MNLDIKLNRLQLTQNIQTDYSYFNSVAYKVFSDFLVYAKITSCITEIVQLGNILFSYESNPDSSDMIQYYQQLLNSTSECITESNNVISQIPKDNPDGNNFKIILQALIVNCEQIQAIIPTTKQAKGGLK